jgi:hypothetical protein
MQLHLVEIVTSPDKCPVQAAATNTSVAYAGADTPETMIFQKLRKLPPNSRSCGITTFQHAY